MKNYKVLESGYVVMEQDNMTLVIPNDPANTDFQAYLRWLNGEDEDGRLS